MTVWDPPHRLVFGWRQAGFPAGRSTEVSVRFDAVEQGTRVTVEHFGWDAIPQDHAARHGFPLSRVPATARGVVASAAAFAWSAGHHLNRVTVGFGIGKHRPQETTRMSPEPSSGTERLPSGTSSPTS